MDKSRARAANKRMNSGVVLPLSRGLQPSRSLAGGRQRRVAGDAAFVLRASVADCGAPTLGVIDARMRTTLTQWSGPVASVLLASQPVTRILCGRSQGSCGKEVVRKLMLAASVAMPTLQTLTARVDEIVNDDVHATTDAAVGSRANSARQTLTQRLIDARRKLSLDSLTVARTLFQHPGEHFTPSDIEALIATSYPVSDLSRVANSLDELVRYDVIQRIELAPSLVFYDIDITPHAHRYDPATGQLFDA